MRFNPNCNSLQEAREYYRNRAIQLLSDGFFLVGKILPLIDKQNNEWGACASFQKWTRDSGWENAIYKSVYVYKGFRNQGRLKTWINSFDSVKMITSPGCNLEEFFKINLTRSGDKYVVAAQLTKSKEYRLIESIYGDKKAKRSGQYLMNHIDEGLFVLKYFGASEIAQRAYCLHPVVQVDSALSENLEELSDINPITVALAMEYRSVANEYLSHRKISNISEIRLSPIKEVTDMLKADKVQNYKDFLIYHSQTHARKNELHQYFSNWLAKLEIPRREFNMLKKMLYVKKV